MSPAAARAACASVLIVALCGAAPPAPVPSTIAAPSPGPAASGTPNATPSLDTGYYTVSSDLITYKRNGNFSIPQHVAFSRPGSDGTADRADGNSKRGTVTMAGNVVIHDNGNAPEAGVDAYSKGGPSTLTCDRLDVDAKTKLYTAIGHVHFEQGARNATAQRAVLNRTSGMLRLEGDVKTSDGESSLSAQNLDYNTNTKVFGANGKPIIIKQPVPSPEPRTASPSPPPKKRKLPF